MKEATQLVVFGLDEQRYALRLAAVERIVRAVEVTPLPKAPQIVLGVIDIQGRVIPVVDVRKRFRLPEREVELGDQFIIAHTGRRTVALVVDAVSGVVECSAGEVRPAEEILPGMEYIEGVVRLRDGMALIHDLDRFLSLNEENALEQAIGLA